MGTCFVLAFGSSSNRSDSSALGLGAGLGLGLLGAGFCLAAGFAGGFGSSSSLSEVSTTFLALGFVVVFDTEAWGFFPPSLATAAFLRGGGASTSSSSDEITKAFLRFRELSLLDLDSGFSLLLPIVGLAGFLRRGSNQRSLERLFCRTHISVSEPSCMPCSFFET